MSDAFNEFMRQYNMTGSEKADGYSREAFVGLDDQEKETVFQLLVSELPYSVDWLFFLNPQKAVASVREKEKVLRGDSYGRAFDLQESLVAHTGDLSYQDQMINDYHIYAYSLKPLAIDAIGRTQTNTKTVGFFKKIILTESNPNAVARAARQLLKALKIRRDSESEESKYRQLLCDLRSELVDQKLSALRELAVCASAQAEGE